jgi:deazaflavin-dependent oxidoreductase (nitroreductase family)
MVRARTRWHRVQDLVYYAGEYVLIGLVGPTGPRRLMRRVFRAPILLYRCGLGPLVGHNVLILRTVGRQTGRAHHTAMRFEYDPKTDTFYVLSGWRGRTDWYRNVSRDRRVEVRVGTRRFVTLAELLPPEASEPVLRSYLARNPMAIGTIRKETGTRIAAPEDLSTVVHHYPAVALRPLASTDPSR